MCFQWVYVCFQRFYMCFLRFYMFSYPFSKKVYTTTAYSMILHVRLFIFLKINKISNTLNYNTKIRRNIYIHHITYVTSDEMIYHSTPIYVYVYIFIYCIYHISYIYAYSFTKKRQSRNNRIHKLIHIYSNCIQTQH